MTIKIEITASPDIHTIAAIHDACFPKSWSSDVIRDMFSVAGTTAFLAGGIGFAMLRSSGLEAEVLTLAVLPQARNRGVGQALMHAICEWAQAQHIQALFLEVNEHNDTARKLYEKEGFGIIAQRREYYCNTDGTSDHALVMKLALF